MSNDQNFNDAAAETIDAETGEVIPTPSAKEDASSAYGKADPQPLSARASAAAKARRPAGKPAATPVKRWGPIDTKAAAKRALPPPGDYGAIISDVQLHDKGDTLWLGVSYSLNPPFDGEILDTDFGAVAVADGSPHARRIAEGGRLLNRTALAAGIVLPDELDPYNLPALLKNASVTLRLAHKTIDGVPALIVRRALPAAA